MILILISANFKLKLFLENGPLPSIEDLEKSISVMLINTHFSINKPRPLMPGLINIAGAHIKPPKTLPADIQVHILNTQ